MYNPHHRVSPLTAYEHEQLFRLRLSVALFMLFASPVILGTAAGIVAVTYHAGWWLWMVLHPESYSPLSVAQQGPWLETLSVFTATGIATLAMGCKWVLPPLRRRMDSIERLAGRDEEYRRSTAR